MQINKITKVITIALFFIFICNVVEGRIIYVDDDATGFNDGSPAVPAASRGRSWENAYIYLQDALSEAKLLEKPVEIRVAQGVYTPDKGADYNSEDYNAAFELINDVNLSGGYAGVLEDDPNIRDIELYETILSGDLKGNDIDANSLDPNNIISEPSYFLFFKLSLFLHSGQTI